MRTTQLRNPARASRRVPQFAPRKAAATKYTQIDTNVPKTTPESVEPKFVQLQIIRLFMQGCSRREISRQTRRSRQTVAKVLKLSVIGPMKRQELREILVSESDSWLESISYAVATQTDGKLAFRLLQRFGIIPTLENEGQRNRTSIG